MSGAVLIAGGYGVVGLQIAELIRKRNPDLLLLLAGRTKSSADAAADVIGHAQGIVMDVEADDPLANVNLPIRAVLAAVNDPQDALLKSAIKRAIPYVDITRWTERLEQAHKLAVALEPAVPVTLASSWMAGVAAILAKRTCREIGKVDRIEISILYRLNDKAGPNSVEYADRLSVPFRVREHGKWRKARAFTDPIRVEFPGGDAAKAYRFDEPGQETLVAATGAASVSSRIAYDDASATRSLMLMVRSGLWTLISGKAFTSLRHSLIYHPGEGASHEIVVEAAGSEGKRRATLVDPKGQTHLTALGAYIQLCETIGLEDRPPRRPGVHFPEHETDPEFACKILSEEGVEALIAEM